MIRGAILVVLLAAGVILAGCGPSDENGAAPAGEQEKAVSDGQDANQGAISGTAEPAATTAKKQEAPELPEGFPKVVHIWPEIIVQSVEATNPDALQYKVEGMVAANPEEVLDYYTKYFRENGWTEDMVMVQEINSVVSFKKDGVLEYVEAEVGGIGSRVTITTGKI